MYKIQHKDGEGVSSQRLSSKKPPHPHTVSHHRSMPSPASELGFTEFVGTSSWQKSDIPTSAGRGHNFAQLAAAANFRVQGNDTPYCPILAAKGLYIISCSAVALYRHFPFAMPCQRIWAARAAKLLQRALSHIVVPAHARAAVLTR